MVGRVLPAGVRCADGPGLVATVRRAGSMAVPVPLPRGGNDVRASIGASAIGASLFAQAGASFAAGDGGPGSQGSQGGQGDVAPPVLRYAGSASAMPGGNSTATTPGLRPAGALGMPAGSSLATGPVLGRAGRAGRAGQSPTSSNPPSTALGSRHERARSPPTDSGHRRRPGAPRDQGLDPHPIPRRSPLGDRVPPPAARRLQPLRIAPAVNGEVAPGRTWTVRPGDSLWSIAETALSAAWGSRPPPGRSAGTGGRSSRSIVRLSRSLPTLISSFLATRSLSHRPRPGRAGVDDPPSGWIPRRHRRRDARLDGCPDRRLPGSRCRARSSRHRAHCGNDGGSRAGSYLRPGPRRR